MLVVISFAVFIFGRRMNPTHAVIILLTVLLLSVAGMAVNSHGAQKRM